MVVLPPRRLDVPEFISINTLTPRDHPLNLRRFRVPSRFRGWRPSVHVDGDRCLGTLDRDRPLITDPTEAIFILELVARDDQRVLIVVRIQTLIEHLCSVSTDGCVPWDEWRRGAVVMKVPQVPQRGHGHTGSKPFVHGVHVVLMEQYTDDDVERSQGSFHLRTFGFSQRGCGALPLCDEGNGAERRASFEDGRKLLLQKDKGMVEYVLDSSGDSNFMHLASCLNRWGEWQMTDGMMRITMLVRTLCCIFGSWFEAPITVLSEVARTRTCVVQVDGLLVSLALWQNELVTRRIHYLLT